MELNNDNSVVKRSTSQAELDKALQEEEMEEHFLCELLKAKVDDDQISLNGLTDDLRNTYHYTNTQVEELQTLLDQGDAEKTLDQNLDVLSVANASEISSDGSVETKSASATLQVQTDVKKTDEQAQNHDVLSVANASGTSSDGSVETKSASATLQVQTDVKKMDDKVKVHVPLVENGSHERSCDVVRTDHSIINQLGDTVPTAIVEQTNSEPAATTDKDENNASSGVETQNDGSLLTSGDKSCFGESSEGVQTFRAEASSSQALNTGVPPGCEAPHSECLGVQGVIHSEHDSTDGSHLLLISIKQSGGDTGQEIDPVEGRDEEDITGGFPNNKVEVDQIVVNESSDAMSSKNQQSGKPKTKNKDKAKKTDKVKKQESKKEKKEQEKKTRKAKEHKRQERKREKKEQGKKTGKEEGEGEKKEKRKKTAEKVKDTKTGMVEVMDKDKEADTTGTRSIDEKTKSKKSRRGLLGLFCCCFKGQDIDDGNEKPETEKSRNTTGGHSEDASTSSLRQRLIWTIDIFTFIVLETFPRISALFTRYL